MFLGGCLIQTIMFSSAMEHMSFPRKEQCIGSLFFPMFGIIALGHLSGTMNSLKFFSTCKLISYPATVSLKLTEDTKLLGERQKINMVWHK